MSKKIKKNKFSTLTKYVILDQSSNTSFVRSFLNNTSIVRQVTVDQQNPYILGGQNIPADQVRDFRAFRLENQDAVAYTTNIRVSDLNQEPENVNQLLEDSIPTITSFQTQTLLLNGVTQDTIDELQAINEVVRRGVEELIVLNSNDLVYANRIYNFIREANVLNYNRSEFVVNPYHLYHLDLNNNQQTESLNREIMRFFVNVRGGPLASRVLNLFLALGYNFMDYINSQFLLLSNNTLPTEWLNNSSELFLVQLRQSLSSLSILFLGLDQFISTDLGQMLYILRTVILYLGPILSIIKYHNLILSNIFLSS